AENVANGFGSKQFSIAGAGPDGSGALVNNGGPQQFNAFQQVILTGDATIGGSNTGTTTTGRLDLRNNTPQLDLAGFTLTKTGNNQFSLVGVNVTDGNIVVNNGTLGIEATTTIADNASGKSIAYNASAGVTTTAWFYHAGGTTIGGGTLQVGAGGTSGTLGAGSVTNNANLAFNRTDALAVANNISGSGNLFQNGTGTTTLSGGLSYSGTTNINAGALQL